MKIISTTRDAQWKTFIEILIKIDSYEFHCLSKLSHSPSKSHKNQAEPPLMVISSHGYHFKGAQPSFSMRYRNLHF